MKDVSNSEYQVIATEKQGVSVFWWIFWLILFWPMLVVTAIIHFNSETVYRVQYKLKNGKVVVDKMTEKQYNHFVNQ